MKDIIRKIARVNYSLPGQSKIKKITDSFSPIERAAFIVLALVLVLSAFWLLWKVNSQFLVEIPDHGGQIDEAVIGYPHLINPLFAVSDVDKDLTALLYSGLMKVDAEGKLVPNLVKSYDVSADGKTYTFNLKDNIYFHDGAPITADDVEFTIQKALDPALKSPRRANWEGVTVQKVDARTIKFSLRVPFISFLDVTTIGILPKHLWKNIDDEQFSLVELNTNPIGSGPYQINSIKRSSDVTGVPLDYELKSFSQYALGEPYVKYFVVHFYPSEDAALSAYQNGDIDSLNGFSPQKSDLLKNNKTKITAKPLPRLFGLFFNQNQAPVFINKEVRQALEMSVDREAIISQVLNGYGTAIESPLPISLFNNAQQATTTSIDDRVSAAQALLKKNGWKAGSDGILTKTVKKQTYSLSFTISTSNAEDLRKTAELLKQQWQKLGAQVDVKIYEYNDLTQTIIRPRKYGALLFGEVVGRDLDLYAFWHSSQRNDPGYNIALYANTKVDKLLETIRTEIDNQKRMVDYKSLESEINKDVPAIFLYSPEFLYAIPSNVKNFSVSEITSPSDRFAAIESWYVETQKVWPFFVKN